MSPQLRSRLQGRTAFDSRGPRRRTCSPHLSLLVIHRGLQADCPLLARRLHSSLHFSTHAWFPRCSSAQSTSLCAERSCPSINILQREGAGSGEKHLIFQSTPQIDLCCVFLYPQRGFQSLLLALFVEVLVSSTLPFTPPLPPPSLPDAHTPLLHSHNSAVTWQRGPSWTQHQPRCHGN